MANSLPNRITKAQAETAANASYTQFTELARVYDEIAAQSEGGAFSYSTTVSDPEIASFVKSELLADGYTLSGEDIGITITWGTVPAT